MIGRSTLREKLLGGVALQVADGPDEARLERTIVLFLRLLAHATSWYARIGASTTWSHHTRCVFSGVALSNVTVNPVNHTEQDRGL